MIWWLLVILALVALGAIVQSDLTWRERRAERALRAIVDAPDRYVDVGVELRTVVQDEAGTEIITGAPPMRVLRVRRFGGMLDTAAIPRRIIGPSRDPLIWYCSEDQEAVLLHSGTPRGQLVYGSEGAGKTTVLAQWHYLQWMRRLGEGREGLQTAPTLKRLGLVKREIIKLWRPTWHRYVARKDFEGFELIDGCSLRMVSTHRQSEAQGSPVQGFNSSWAGRDEMQDQIEVDDDIEQRGRAAKGGGEEYDQLGTATAKDSPAWRDLRAVKLASGAWLRRTLLIMRSPFVSAKFIATKKSGMSDREFRRRFGAEDLPPERAVYPAWSRDHNLIRVPSSWVDVTRRELARWGDNMCALVGHDPGTLFDVSLIIKAYQVTKGLPWWVVVGEVTTEQTTTEQHVATFLDVVRDRWMMNLLAPARDLRTGDLERDRQGQPTGRMVTAPDGPKVLVRADPYGNNDSKPDRSCYTIWRNAGVTIHPAAYNSEGDSPGRVPKGAGIEVVNTLFCNADQERRLYVAMDERGAPCAPRLVDAIESSERDTDGKAETQRKDKKDVSHWPASLRYAMWAVERPRLHITRTA